jgi:hypothetical protein
MTTIKTNIANGLACICLAMGSMVFATSMQAQSGIITHSPEVIETRVGETFEVNVNVNAGGTPVSVIDLHMRFNPSELQVVSLESLVSNMSSLMLPASYNNQLGTINVGAFEIGDNLPTGQFGMLKITFKAMSATASAYVAHPQNEFPRSILAYAGENTLASIGDLQINVLPAVTSSVSQLISDAPSAGVAVWPNPASDHVFVNFDVPQSGVVLVEVLDASGKVVAEVYRGSAAGGSPYRFEVNVSHLNTGMYLCRMITDNGVFVDRMVVRK